MVRYRRRSPSSLSQRRGRGEHGLGCGHPTRARGAGPGPPRRAPSPCEQLEGSDSFPSRCLLALILLHALTSGSVADPRGSLPSAAAHRHGWLAGRTQPRWQSRGRCSKPRPHLTPELSGASLACCSIATCLCSRVCVCARLRACACTCVRVCVCTCVCASVRACAGAGSCRPLTGASAGAAHVDALREGSGP